MTRKLKFNGTVPAVLNTFFFFFTKYDIENEAKMHKIWERGFLGISRQKRDTYQKPFCIKLLTERR